MRKSIFTDGERQMLEAFLTSADVDSVALSKILRRIRRHRILFEDVYLYLQVRRMMTG